MPRHRCREVLPGQRATLRRGNPASTPLAAPTAPARVNREATLRQAAQALLDAWDDAEIYNTGDAAYYNMDTYLSLVDGNVNKPPPSVSDDNWQMFRIPWVFRTFVTLAAFGDTLVVAGQNEKAPDQIQQAYAALASEFDKQTIQAGQFTGYSARVI